MILFPLPGRGATHHAVSRTAFALSVACALSLASPAARAELPADDRARLAHGELVLEEAEVHRADRVYVGGVAYMIANAPAARLSAIARDVRRYRELFPALLEAKLVRLTPAGRAIVRMTHALGPFRGGYTVVVGFEEGGLVGRFWLDRTADNDVEDAWGFVRLTPLGDGARTLVTYGVLIDLGPGVLRSLFETRIKFAALAYPRRLADAASY